MNIHPNPTNGMLNIEIDGVRSEVIVSVFNILGEKVLENNFSAEESLNASIDLSNQTNGTYILQVRTNDNVWTMRIIKE